MWLNQIPCQITYKCKWAIKNEHPVIKMCKMNLTFKKEYDDWTVLKKVNNKC